MNNEHGFITSAPEVGDNFDSAITRESYADRPETPIQVFCDCCPNEAFGFKSMLRKIGWEVYSREAFCPQHTGF